LELLNQRAPNNFEQMEVFNFVKNAIDKAEHDREQSTYIFINGPAGSGKSTLSQKSKDFNLLLEIFYKSHFMIDYSNGICKIEKTHRSWNSFNKLSGNGIICTISILMNKNN
jgi:ABC-type polar amino acid transport system ATPase subunit